jgi:hypothetical protein
MKASGITMLMANIKGIVIRNNKSLKSPRNQNSPKS